MRVFIGMDERQPLAYTVLQSSIVRRASRPVSITPLLLSQLPPVKRGLTDFTYSRYLVPYLCEYEGTALFMDADMVCQCDIYDLEAYAGSEPVAVVPHSGAMSFERPSLMLFNNSMCPELTPEYIKKNQPGNFQWADSVGALPAKFNHLVGYDKPTGEEAILHYTAGIPDFKEVFGMGFEREWLMEKEIALKSPSWFELMGKSVHARKVMERFQ